MDTASSASLERAGRWFLTSGIQEPFGGVARYYRSDLHANARVSTEITGYTISALVYLHSRTRDAQYLDAAVRAGRFLTRRAWDGQAATFPFEYAVNGSVPHALAYFFDAGIIVRGLLALWRATGDAEYLESAERCGESMARDFAAGCDFHPVLALPSKEPLPRENRWSRSAGCYQLKAALGWHELADQTGRPEFRPHYEAVLGYALANHPSFLPGEAPVERVMDRLHAYCYFLEGLLPSAGRPECCAALAEGIERTGRFLREIAPVFERSDVNAQLLRVRLFASALGAVPLDRKSAEEEAGRIAGFQSNCADPRIQGGYFFGRKGAEPLPFVNPVSTAFCLQALEMWRQYAAGEFEPVWQILV